MAVYFLGVDGGQSSTSAVIGDESGRVLAYGRGGPCNHVQGPGGREKFIGAIAGCVGQALAAAGLAATQSFAVACFGFSGGPADKKALLTEILDVREQVVTNDAVIALAGAHGGAPGVITIAGTGSISLARGADGVARRVGGWGYVFGDEGGAFDMVRQALRAALRMEEGWGPATTLRERLLTATGAESADDLVHRFYTVEFSRPRIASFARLVDEAAEQGDETAHAILFNTARELAQWTEAGCRLAFAPGERARIAYIGGVFRSATVLSEFRRLLETKGDVVPPLYGPATGALLEAYQHAGLAVTIAAAPDEKA